MTYRVADADQMDKYRGAMRRVRRDLGIRSFGINHSDLPPNDEGYPAHDETETNHEELYFVVAGSGELTVDGETTELKPGRYVYVTPQSHRMIRSGPEGLSYLVIGAPIDRDYGGWDDLSVPRRRTS